MVKIKKLTMWLLIIVTLFSTGCGRQREDAKDVFTYGTMAYGPAMGNAGTNPHTGYSGWSTLRYGIGETLFKFNDAMQAVPWLAKACTNIDDYTVKIDLRDDVYFSNGKKVTGEAVKACLEDLIAKNARAKQDLKLASIEADGQSVVLKLEQKVPAIINYLADPYACIIDMEAGENNHIVAGTGPYIPVTVTDKEIILKKNDNYWGENKPKLAKIIVKGISDGNTLTLAMQSGELDAVQGLPYASLDLFQDKAEYQLSTADTSRIYQIAFNFKNPALQDLRVRRAIAISINKAGFASVLLHGQGTPAKGPFPSSLPFGDSKRQAATYDLAAAKNLLKEAGYVDSDGDGIVEKAGKPLKLRYLTYTSRQELPLLAEAVQADLKKIGIAAAVNATDNFKDFRDNGEFDLYANAFVTAPTGDPEYYFLTHFGKNAPANYGHYQNEELSAKLNELATTYDTKKRADLAAFMGQMLAIDVPYVYVARLRMTLVMKNNIKGLKVHPSDYYEITPELSKE